jgi:hypothetical protein
LCCWRALQGARVGSDRHIEALLRDIAARSGAALVEVTDYLCPGASCRLHDRNKALYFDRHHVSVHGARALLPLLAAHLPMADGPTR